VLAASDLFQGNGEAALLMGSAVEMIHAYSLIHDDLPCMDDDDFRRGKPSNHKVYGEAMALLAGDALLTYAFELLWQNAPAFCESVPSYNKACAEIARAAGPGCMIAGQAADMENGEGIGAGKETLSYIHQNKTGALLRASLLSGALCAELSAEDEKAMALYGERYGLLFQITDDILDVEGSLEALGKTPGKDVKNGKLTYVTCYGLDEAKRLAIIAAEEAKAALAPYGARAWFLNALVDNTLFRKS